MKNLKKTKKNDVTKIIYLEIIDAVFSVDGVIGAFAFTFFVPFIIIGNGIGALVVRHFTIKNIDSIGKYRFIKNGAMYSIFVLGLIMILDAFSIAIPDWIAPLMTFGIVGFFIFES